VKSANKIWIKQRPSIDHSVERKSLNYEKRADNPYNKAITKIIYIIRIVTPNIVEQSQNLDFITWLW